MSTLTIRKKSLKTWLHTDSILGDFIISKFYFNADNVSFQIVEQGQSKRVIYDITDISLYPLPSGGTAETFTTITQLSLRLEELNYPAFQYDGQITSIANLIDAGTGVTITGDGTEANPYVISATGGGGSQNLQQVTDEGNETTNPVKVAELQLYDIPNDDYGKLVLDDSTFIFKSIGDVSEYSFSGGNYIVDFSKADLTSARNYELPNETGRIALSFIRKTTNFTAVIGGAYATNGTITVTDSPTTQDTGYIVHVIGGTTTIGGVGYTAGALVYRFYNGSSWVSTDMNAGVSGAVLKSDYTPSHSILVQQSGTGSPTALQVGNNTLVGRVSGGGSDIDDLSTSQVRSMLSINNVDNTSDANKPVSTATQTALDLKADKSSTPSIVVRNITPSTALTGTTIETQITSFNFTIPANTFSANDILKVETISWEKSGTANASSCRLKLSNTNNYAGASNVLILAASGGNINMRGTRTYKIAGGNLKGFMSASANGIFNDNTLSSVAVSTLALDVTQPIYGFVSLTNSSSADSTIMNELIISKW